ncbi:unnamed protein product [Chondrus crispus]|uniref:Uncharacterized protein n=1 Tax=Chondrus crispus TaxID=2769 RepID=R7QGA2_CHOCR|nr:unnamed protein product [Chondrus crispus]CDF37542.1 unnamed protein product [Chondrus crispus]|eukprot:XP_005717413.1 unnamed protein product [Chondrus crispus]
MDSAQMNVFLHDGSIRHCCDQADVKLVENSHAPSFRYAVSFAKRVVGTCRL